MSEASREAATTELMQAAMAISRSHKLGAVGLISILTDVTHKLAETYCKVCERADEEQAPKELDAWTATQSSPFLIATHTDAKGRPVYWVERASKYIMRWDEDWYSSDDRPEDCPEFGWKPVENSDIAGIISEKARTL